MKHIIVITGASSGFGALAAREALLPNLSHATPAERYKVACE